MNRYLLLILCIRSAQAVCKLPVNFTYFQKALGYYCQSPNLYLENQYGGSFAEETNGVARETNDPYVRFAISEVTSWDTLAARTAELDPGVAKGGVHTPSLFWDGRQDIYFHANADEDTISTDFKSTVDGHIENCLSSALRRADSSTTVGDKNESILCFVFFFSRGCPHCAKVKEYINGDLQNADVTFQYETYDVYDSDYSRRLIAGYNYFGWKGRQVVPTIFIGDENDMTVLVGEDEIFDRLLPRIQELNSEPTPCFDFATLLEEHPELADSDLHWGVLTAAALVDSINPCAIAVLLILLGALVQSVVPAAPNTEQVHPEGPASTSPSSSQLPNGDQAGESDNKKGETAMLDVEDAKTNEPETTALGEEKAMTVNSELPEDDQPGDSDTRKGETILTDEEEAKMNGPDSTLLSEEKAMTANSVSAKQEVDVAAEANSSHHDAKRNPDGEDAKRGSQARRRRAFLSGMAFIASVFISYYALGFGVFAAVSSTKASSQILLALGIFIIFLGAWNFKDYFCYEIGYNVEIPRSWRPRLKRLLGAVTSPWGAFAAGFLVCLFELPCTGGPYLFILGLLADRNTRTEAAFLLLYYNFIFVLPLIIINCMVFWGAAMLEKVGSWKEKYVRHLHLFAGLVLITLGVLAVVDSRIEIF